MAKTLFNRYIWLIELIARKGKITLKEINNEWIRSSFTDDKPIPEKTFHNHRKAIEDTFDINIACDKSTNSYYIENQEDLANGGVRTWLLNTFAVNNMINESHKLKKRILFENIPSGQKYLTAIIEAMRESKTIQVTYGSYWSDPATFEIEPYFVKVFKQRWYLVGKSDMLRIYGLDRIQELSITNKSFIMPHDPDPELFFLDCYGVIQHDDTPARTIRLKVDTSQVNYLRSLPLHHSQQELELNEDFVVFEYYIKPTFDFIQEILSHGDALEVIYPADFRNEIKVIAHKMYKLYSGKET